MLSLLFFSIEIDAQVTMGSSVAPNVTHPGGSEEQVAYVAFDIYSGDHTSAAGTDIVTNLFDRRHVENIANDYC